MQMGGFVAGHVAQVPSVSSAKLANECEIIFHSRSGFFGIDMVENTPELDACRLTFISRGIAADLEFAQRFAPGGREVGRNRYGWVYRYTKNR